MDRWSSRRYCAPGWAASTSSGRRPEVEPWAEVSSFGLTLLFMLIGLVGLVIPIFPGILVIWLAALGYGVVTGFTTLGTILFVLITLLMLFGVTIDNILMGAGARQGGASW